MCSTSVQRIAEIGRAIDDLAAEAHSAYAAAARRGQQRVAPGAAVTLPERPTQGTPAAVPAASGPAASGPVLPGQAAGVEADQIVIRLAELWAQLARLDPEVARRLPTYEA